MYMSMMGVEASKVKKTDVVGQRCCGLGERQVNCKVSHQLWDVVMLQGKYIIMVAWKVLRS